MYIHSSEYVYIHTYIHTYIIYLVPSHISNHTLHHILFYFLTSITNHSYLLFIHSYLLLCPTPSTLTLLPISQARLKYTIPLHKLLIFLPFFQLDPPALHFFALGSIYKRWLHFMYYTCSVYCTTLVLLCVLHMLCFAVLNLFCFTVLHLFCLLYCSVNCTTPVMLTVLHL